MSESEIRTVYSGVYCFVSLVDETIEMTFGGTSSAQLDDVMSLSEMEVLVEDMNAAMRAVTREKQRIKSDAWDELFKNADDQLREKMMSFGNPK